jgi:hypothetical protein
MAYEYDEEAQHTGSTKPPATAAGTPGKATSPTSPAQLPIWTQGAGSHMHEGERSVRWWLDENVEKLGTLSLTLSQLVQCALDNVPRAVKLSRIQIETIICEWATDHNITILHTLPPPSGRSSIAIGEPDEKEHKKRSIRNK